jgi:uncharacterized protein (DUF4415 family)
MAIVRRTSEQIKAARMTPEQQARFDAIREEDIDYSDIPEPPDDAVWTRPGALVSPENKKQMTVRLDADVIEFFRKTGKKYQTRMNAVLREYMLAQKRAG